MVVASHDSLAEKEPLVGGERSSLPRAGACRRLSVTSPGADRGPLVRAGCDPVDAPERAACSFDVTLPMPGVVPSLHSGAVLHTIAPVRSP